jgi:hypothetical protein
LVFICVNLRPPAVKGVSSRAFVSIRGPGCTLSQGEQ